MTTFVYAKERETLVSYPFLIPTGKLLSILSSPLIKNDTNILHIFEAFSKGVWISLIFSYLIMVFLNNIRISEFRLKYNIAIDYLAILFGKGKTCE
jgi:hypothetical protein